MSSPIWTHDALPSEFRAIATSCWRVVEAQHHVSTLKLTDTLAEQELLEQIIEETKPSLPPECAGLDYLLATPFRYGAVYPTGSRFRRAGRTEGVFYAAEKVQTGLAELAFYRLLFFAESPDTPWPRTAAEYTAFSAQIRSPHMLDLTLPPFDVDHKKWTALTDYAPCQAFAEAARKAEADVICYSSVRDPGKGHNLAVLRCRAFARKSVISRQSWRLGIGKAGIRALCEHPRLSIAFLPESFSADPRLATLNWDRVTG
jgi:RES domain